MRRVLFLLLILLPAGPLRAQTEESADPPIPLAGRPEIFSGASGRFRLEMGVVPETVAQDEVCVLSVYISAAGPVSAPPERLALEEEILANFHVEELGIFPELNETVRAAALFGLGMGSSPQLLSLAGLMPTRSWEFRYRLRPRRLGIDEVPGIAFCYHDPLLQTASRPFMVQYAEPLSFRVLPPQTFVTPLTGPEALFAWTSGDLLARVTPPGLPSLPVLVFLGVLPVLGCLVWYRIWQRLYPDAARQATIRRSRAARIALADLARIRTTDRAGAHRTAEILARYFRERLDFQPNEPTPGEVAVFFRHRGISEPVTEAMQQILERLAAARFGDTAPGATELLSQIRRLILALEEDPCLASA